MRGMPLSNSVNINVSPDRPDADIVQLWSKTVGSGAF